MNTLFDRKGMRAVIVTLAVYLSLGDAAPAQKIELPIPGAPISPTSRQQCQDMSQKWSQITRSITQQHSDCLTMPGCKSSAGDAGTECSCRACLRLHLIMTRYNSGDLAQIRKQRMEECNQKVAAYETDQRQKRQAAEEDQRARQQAANQAAQQYADAQRQYNDMQRRQREHQNAVNAQKLEKQRRQVERLQQQQRQSEAALASFSSLFGRDSGGGKPASQTELLPERPQSVIGATLYDASKIVNLASSAKQDIGAVLDAMTVVFSNDRQGQEKASANLASSLESKAIDAAAAGTTAAIVAMMPQRNDHNDPGFSVFFEAAQNSTTGLIPAAPGISFIQRTAGGVLENMLQQTLGDMAQLQQDITSFSSGTNSYYSTSPVAGNRGSSGGLKPSQNALSETVSVPPANRNLAREEVQALRNALRYALIETRVSSPTLARLARMDTASVGSRSGATCKDRGSAVADGKQICRDGVALLCQGGQLHPTGRC